MAVTPQDVASAMAIFGRVLMQVDDEHLELETPCTDWNVEALISHVVLGDVATAMIFEGQSLDGMSMIDTSILGPNPVATWRGTALKAITTLQEPGAMERVVQHVTGPQPGSMVAGFRLVDVLGHASDLAQAIGVPAEITDDLADSALEFLLPMVEQMKDSPHFAAPLLPAENASPEERFLALLGRRVAT